MNVWGPILATFLGGGLVQFIASLASKKKTDAESTNLITEAADRIVSRLENEIKDLREQQTAHREQSKQQTNELKNEIISLKNEINILRNEVKRLGGDPDLIIRKASENVSGT